MSEEQQRIAALEARVDSIDQHGTRGMEAVRAQISGVQRDLGRVDSGVERLETAVQTLQLDIARHRPGAGAWARDVALIAPMYGLVIDLIIRGLR
jgi:hypothetical protein